MATNLKDVSVLEGLPKLEGKRMCNVLRRELRKSGVTTWVN
jgi:hypothetical protein